MGVLSRKAGRVRRQARPVGISILWKPLRDPHYVVASLQPGGGGLRQIFAHQSTLTELQALARANPEQAMAGLLLGKRLDCSLNLTPYVLIESHVHVGLSSLDERAKDESRDDGWRGYGKWRSQKCRRKEPGHQTCHRH